MTTRLRWSRIPAVVLLIAACSGEPDQPPNIVFIMADDLGYGHLGSYGQERIRTPNIDGLAAQGTRFTQFYSGSTVCAPARSVLMTGMHTGHTSVRGNTGGIPILDADVTVGEVLQEAGYTTGMFGKWGLGDAETTGVPNRQGFDAFFGYLHQVHAHFYYPYFLWENEEAYLLEGNEGGAREVYTHDIITEKAMQFVREQREAPFFLYLSYTIPHTELLVPDESFAEYEGQFPEPNPYVSPNGHYADQANPRTAFAAMVTRMDRDVGRVLALLDSLALSDNTIVFFTSDNGGQRGGGPDLDFFRGNADLRGAKGNLYEGGIRVPMIARWPGRIAEGAVSDHPWAFWDVMPTLADLAGGTVPDSIDGLSMLPALLGDGGSAPQHEFLYWENGGEANLQQAVRWGKWKAVRPRGVQTLELYDLEADVSETTDVASRHPDVIATIESYLATARVPPREYLPEEATYSYRRENTGYIR